MWWVYTSNWAFFWVGAGFNCLDSRSVWWFRFANFYYSFITSNYSRITKSHIFSRSMHPNVHFFHNFSFQCTILALYIRANLTTQKMRV